MKRDDIPFAPASVPPRAGAHARAPLRFLTAGSVDDGKSTLIGRLLLDGEALLADQLDALRAKTADAFDLALVTDGLEAEREQGITIDVAYRSFETPQRRFLVADAPGHEQYTRNMVTAAAGSDAALVLVDVTKLQVDAEGDELPTLLRQTRRHALIAHRLGVRHVVFVVNKLDAVADPAAVHDRVERALQAFAREAGFTPVGIVPVSALRGDNVSTRTDLVPGYAGPTLLGLLESLPSGDEAVASTHDRAWLPVQWVDAAGPIGADGQRQRVLWGRIAAGDVAVGDAVTVWPGGHEARVLAVHALAQHAVGRSVGIVLDRPLDVSRGDWLAGGGERIEPVDGFVATLAWLDPEPAVPGRVYELRHGNRWVKGRLAAIESRLDIASLASAPADRLAVNDLGVVRFELLAPVPLTPFAESRVRGAMVVVDPVTHRTSGVLLAR